MSYVIELSNGKSFNATYFNDNSNNERDNIKHLEFYVSSKTVSSYMELKNKLSEDIKWIKVKTMADANTDSDYITAPKFISEKVYDKYGVNNSIAFCSKTNSFIVRMFLITQPMEKLQEQSKQINDMMLSVCDMANIK